VTKDRKADPDEASALTKLSEALDAGTPARKVELTPEEARTVSGLGLLSGKKVIYAANVLDDELADGNDMVKKVASFAEAEGSSHVVVSAQVESELVDLSAEERAEFLESLGVEAGQTGLDKLIPKVYSLLQLRTYYTSGETETKAWTIPAGALAPQAAGVIHSDFEKGFIRAETVAYDDLVEAGTYQAAKEGGKVRSEGKEYEVKDADVLLFRFNV